MLKKIHASMGDEKIQIVYGSCTEVKLSLDSPRSGQDTSLWLCHNDKKFRLALMLLLKHRAQCRVLLMFPSLNK